MWKNLNKSIRVLILAGVGLLAVAAAIFIGALAMRVDVSKARESALAAAGGGEVIGQEIDQEGLWNEYSFDIMSGDTWYEIEVNAFGQVTSLESSRGGSGSYGHWD